MSGYRGHGHKQKGLFKRLTPSSVFATTAGDDGEHMDDADTDKRASDGVVFVTTAGDDGEHMDDADTDKRASDGVVTGVNDSVSSDSMVDTTKALVYRSMRELSGVVISLTGRGLFKQALYIMDATGKATGVGAPPTKAVILDKPPPPIPSPIGATSKVSSNDDIDFFKFTELRAQVLLASNDYVHAAGACHFCLCVHVYPPPSPHTLATVYQTLGRCYRNMGHVKGAVEAFAHAKQLCPEPLVIGLEEDLADAHVIHEMFKERYKQEQEMLREAEETAAMAHDAITTNGDSMRT